MRVMRVLVPFLMCLAGLAEAQTQKQQALSQMVQSEDDIKCKFASWPMVLHVSTFPFPPFMFVNYDENNMTRFSGFSFDLLQALAVSLNFCFTLKAIDQQNTTAADVIRDIRNTSTPTNMGIAGLTITAQRLKVIICLSSYSHGMSTCNCEYAECVDMRNSIGWDNPDSKFCTCLKNLSR